MENVREQDCKRAYPRRHGGNITADIRTALAGGLSPQARGKPDVVTVSADGQGPIPAGTGETADTGEEVWG